MSSTLFPLSLKTKKKTKKKSKSMSRIELYAKRLNKELPASEAWFQAKWQRDIVQSKLDSFQDKFNSPYFKKYIPDVLNVGFKYVIEIDGSVHEDEVVKFKDQLKERFYKKRGYKVYRVKAFDETSYQNVLTNIKRDRGCISSVFIKASRDVLPAVGFLPDLPIK